MLHHVITTYIYLMPVKITELRNHGDEVAREEMRRLIDGSPSTPQMKQNFGEFMLLIGDLYKTDPYQLSCDYWPSLDTEQTLGQEQKRVNNFISIWNKFSILQ